MKSDRRHELQQNTLDAELGKVMTFLRKRGSAILWGVVAVALVASLVLFVSRQRRNEAARVQSEYMLTMQRASSPPAAADEVDQWHAEIVTAFSDLADQGRVAWVAADANVRLGHLYARQAAVAAAMDDRAEAAQLAARYYQRAINEHPRQTQAVAAARLGLAKLAENAGDFQAAREQYQAVAAMPGMQGYPLGEQAAQALKDLDSLPGVPRVFVESAPLLEPADEPTEPAAEPTEPAAEPTAEPTPAPATEPAAEPAVEPTEPTTAPAAEPTEPTTAPAAEPTEPATAPAVEPAVEPTTAPASGETP